MEIRKRLRRKINLPGGMTQRFYVVSWARRRLCCDRGWEGTAAGKAKAEKLQRICARPTRVVRVEELTTNNQLKRLLHSFNCPFELGKGNAISPAQLKGGIYLSKEDVIEIEGTVLEALPNAHISGRIAE